MTFCLILLIFEFLVYHCEQVLVVCEEVEQGLVFENCLEVLELEIVFHFFNFKSHLGEVTPIF